MFKTPGWDCACKGDYLPSPCLGQSPCFLLRPSSFFALFLSRFLYRLNRDCDLDVVPFVENLRKRFTARRIDQVRNPALCIQQEVNVPAAVLVVSHETPLLRVDTGQTNIKPVSLVASATDVSVPRVRITLEASSASPLAHLCIPRLLPSQGG